MTPEEKKELLKLLVRMKAKVVKEIPIETTICCARAEGYDYEADKRFWEMPENQSQPTTNCCKVCNQPVVMSVGMIKMYEDAVTFPKIICLDCFKENPDAVTA